MIHTDMRQTLQKFNIDGRRREVANWDCYSKYSRSDKIRVLLMKGKCQIIGLGDSGVGSGGFKSS